MKKKAITRKYSPRAKEDNIRREPAPAPVYRTVKVLPQIADFPYRKFAKIAAQVPFTQKEWAAILHLSEKTLQRYAKDNKSFEGIYVDRILQMQELVEKGLETFTSAEAFDRWLRREKPVLGEILTFDSLKTSTGISLVIDQLGRIQQGVYI